MLRVVCDVTQSPTITCHTNKQFLTLEKKIEIFFEQKKKLGIGFCKVLDGYPKSRPKIPFVLPRDGVKRRPGG